MGVNHKITNTVEDFKGLEKRKSDLIDKPGYFNELKNVSFRASGAISKRKGFHKIISNIPLPGETLAEYDLGIASYTPSNELLIMNKNLKRVVEEQLYITNSSNDTSVYVSLGPNENNRLEYSFKSKDTKIIVDIGNGEESSSNPGSIITTKQYFPIESIPIDIPEQTKIFTQASTNDLSLAGGTSYWYEADKNIFSSLDFRKGISFFCSSNSGYLDWVDRCKFFRIDFDDGSYIYSECDAEYRTLVYKKGSDPERYWKSNSLECGTNQTNSGVTDSALKYYFKYAVSIGPSGYFYHMQHSNSFSSTAKTEGTLTPFVEADWKDLDFSGKTVTRVRLAHDFSTQDFSLSNDVVAFANKEVFPQDMQVTLYNSDFSANLVGTSAVSDALSTNYDTFFLFGNGDNDTLTSSSFSFKSHGDNARVSLRVKGSRLTGNTTVFTYPTNIQANGYNTSYIWNTSTVDNLSTSNYYNTSGTIDRNITEGENNEIINISTITSPVTISDMVSIINNLDGIDLVCTTSSSTDIGNIPACLVLPLDRGIISTQQVIALRYFREQDVTKGDTTYNYFENIHQKFVDRLDSFQNISHTCLNRNIYFATGFDEICKYDGARLYRAGLPTPGELTVNQSAEVSALNIGVDEDNQASTDSYYMATFIHQDNNGNIIQSTQSGVKILGNPHSSNTHRHLVEITIPTIQPGTGFDIDNIDIALWRAPNTTTAAVLGASSFYKINTGATPKTITYAEWHSTTLTPVHYVNVTLNKNNSEDTADWTYTIDNNLIHNNSNTTSVKFIDYLSDEEINSNDFITVSDYAEGRHDLPPKAKFITNHQGCLILAGSPDSPNEVFYSLPEFNFITGEIGSEYFPNNANSVIIPGENGSDISGLKTLRETLLIFNEKSISVLSGDITTPGVQYLKKDALTAQGEQGTISPNCLQEWEGSLTFLSENGILSTDSKSYPTELSAPIKPLLLNKDLDRKRAVSFFDADQDVIGFFIPVIDDTTATEGFFNSKKLNKLFVYDVNISGWTEWTDIDMSGGVVRHNKETFFISRLEGQINVHVFKTLSDRSSYSDFNMPIESTLITSWDSLGNSSVFKKYIRLKVFTSDTNQSFEGTDFTLTLYLRSNFDKKDLGPILLYPGAFGGWGIPSWGSFAWGSRDFKGLRTKLLGKSKSISLNFQNNNINENFIISGYAMEVAAPYNVEIKE